MGRSLTPEQLLEETRKKDAHITQREQELSELRRSMEVSDEPAATNNDPQIEEARKLLEQMGYVDKKTVDSLVDEKLTKVQQQQQIAQSVKELSKQYDGSSDYPKFDEEAVIQHALENGIGNLETAYQSLNRAAIIDAEIKKAQTTDKTATPDTSDAPRVEPVDKEALAKKVTPDVAGDNTKLAQVLRDMGQGSIPSKS